MGLFSTLFGKPGNSEVASAIKEGALLVDVRTAAEFSGGSVKNAINIPLDSIPAQLSRFKGKDKIVVFCRSGARSGQAKHLLEQYDFNNVINGGTWQTVQRLISK